MRVITNQAKILAYLAAAALCLGAGYLKAERPCVTDSECFIQCERELGRPCTDADVFGDECPPTDCTE
jgi:hypothetical protein